MKKWIASLILITTITAVVCVARGLNPILDCYARCNTEEQFDNASCTANGGAPECYTAAATRAAGCVNRCNSNE
jgi:hypothetical protein